MKTFPSKIGIGLALLLVLSYVFTMIGLIIDASIDWWIPLSISLLYGFVFFTFFNTKYVLDGHSLIVKVGFITIKTIAIDSIVKLEESRSINSAPASSMHRWEIIYNKFDSIIISPKNAAEFIEELKRINPQVKVSYRVKS